jgi:DNA-binding transcriptional LysR family regulator
MDLKLMARFVAVAELGSMNKAATQMGLSQPALSKSIQALEQQFNATLVVRSQRGIVLTDFGHLLFRHSKWMISEGDKLRNEMISLRSLSLGRVKIGVPPGPGFVSSILPMATSKLAGKNSRFTFEITIGNRDALITPLLHGDFDFIIARLEEDEFSEILQQDPLFYETSVIAVASSHPLAAKPHLSTRDLTRFPWAVLSDSTYLERSLRQLLQSQNLIHERSVLRSNSSLFVKTMLSEGEWIGLLNHDAVRLEGERGQMTLLTPEGANAHDQGLSSPRKMGICYRKDAPLSTAGATLMDVIKAASRVAADKPNSGIRIVRD